MLRHLMQNQLLIIDAELEKDRFKGLRHIYFIGPSHFFYAERHCSEEFCTFLVKFKIQLSELTSVLFQLTSCRV